MSKRPPLTSRHLVVHRLDSTLPFDVIAGMLEAHLAVRPELGLFVEAEQLGLVRIGGLDLRGDILIRPESPGRGNRVLVACRQADADTLEEVLKAMGPMWTRSDRAPSPREGLALLDFLQSDAVLACLDRIHIAERAVEDAFSCRFSSVDALRREIVCLHSRSLMRFRMLELFDENGPCMIHLENLIAPSVILHEGEKVSLGIRHEVHVRGAVLTLHHSYDPKTRSCVIGALTERRR